MLRLSALKRHLFHIKIARREQLRNATGGGDGVEVVPSVFLASENDAACIRELQRLKREQRQRIFHRVAAVKQLAAFAALCVCNPKRPRLWELRNERPLKFQSRLTNKRDLFAVGRPSWTRHHDSSSARGK